MIPGGLDVVRGLSRRTRKNENKNKPKFLVEVFYSLIETSIITI